MELKLYREYKVVSALFNYVVETDRRFYMANQVELKTLSNAGEVYFELILTGAWVWDIYRQGRFVKYAKVLTFKDVNVEELNRSELQIPKDDMDR